MEGLLTVRRWRRYGADRLYVTQETGARVGSVDLQSGEIDVDDPLLEGGLRRAAQAYLRADVPELALSLPEPGVGALDPRDEAALQAWLGGEDWDTIDLDALRRERGSSVRTRLERLCDEGWQVVHDVPLGRQGSLVEHLLVGPAGIFTLSEHRHPGQRVVVEGRTLEVDGRSMSYLRDARLEATRVQGALLAAACAAITVRGVVVVHGDLEVRTVVPEHDAFAITRQDVQSVFRAMPVRLDPARIAAVAHVARQRATWSH
ncbi:NERD domain-containing protein [Cellulomonas fengjieae]|uniref:NERD domain-containing protein n=1 Tax=Cellulomonas fengjieae TaxID=2819978 RepID=A0ABS3SCD9_9CELL|nr:NERD domain-containing protein [Cellulomonas fengjieae]MBO3083392.1 NERD domain-containing protein [Cellulomonas fengjieae]MBO3101857.1 NERD domain-containing protein [Cellulomonas fengjieae]QVI65269.1 NERD domain-containing protein [Cellulomonas fengjieae]